MATDPQVVVIERRIGKPGQAATIQITQTNTGEPGTDASIAETSDSTAQNRKYVLTVPRGNTGAEGTQGIQGEKGDAATIQITQTNTGEPGSDASLTETSDSTSQDRKYILTVPRGEKGEGVGVGDVDQNIPENTIRKINIANGSSLLISDDGYSSIHIASNGTTAINATTLLQLLSENGITLQAGGDVLKLLNDYGNINLECLDDLDLTSTSGSTFITANAGDVILKGYNVSLEASADNIIVKSAQIAMPTTNKINGLGVDNGGNLVTISQMKPFVSWSDPDGAIINGGSSDIEAWYKLFPDFMLVKMRFNNSGFKWDKTKNSSELLFDFPAEDRFPKSDADNAYPVIRITPYDGSETKSYHFMAGFSQNQMFFQAAFGTQADDVDFDLQTPMDIDFIIRRT